MNKLEEQRRLRQEARQQQPHQQQQPPVAPPPPQQPQPQQQLLQRPQQPQHWQQHIVVLRQPSVEEQLFQQQHLQQQQSLLEQRHIEQQRIEQQQQQQFLLEQEMQYQLHLLQQQPQQQPQSQYWQHQPPTLSEQPSFASLPVASWSAPSTPCPPPAPPVATLPPTPQLPLQRPEPPRRLRLCCGGCSAVLTERGMQVRLLMDPDYTLFSTDGRPHGVSQAGEVLPPACEFASPTKTGACECLTQDVKCACGERIGYRMVEPCIACLGGQKWGHPWFFSAHCVEAEPLCDEYGRRLYWPCEPLDDTVEEQPRTLAGPAAAAAQRLPSPPQPPQRPERLLAPPSAVAHSRAPASATGGGGAASSRRDEEELQEDRRCDNLLSLFKDSLVSQKQAQEQLAAQRQALALREREQDAREAGVTAAHREGEARLRAREADLQAVASLLESKERALRERMQTLAAEELRRARADVLDAQRWHARRAEAASSAPQPPVQTQPQDTQRQQPQQPQQLSQDAASDSSSRRVRFADAVGQARSVVASAVASALASAPASQQRPDAEAEARLQCAHQLAEKKLTLNRWEEALQVQGSELLRREGALAARERVLLDLAGARGAEDAACSRWAAALSSGALGAGAVTSVASSLPRASKGGSGVPPPPLFDALPTLLGTTGVGCIGSLGLVYGGAFPSPWTPELKVGQQRSGWLPRLADKTKAAMRSIGCAHRRPQAYPAF